MADNDNVVTGVVFGGNNELQDLADIVGLEVSNTPEARKIRDDQAKFEAELIELDDPVERVQCICINWASGNAFVRTVFPMLIANEFEDNAGTYWFDYQKHNSAIDVLCKRILGCIE